MTSTTCQKRVAADIRAIFNAPDGDEAKRLIARFIATCDARTPKLTRWGVLRAAVVGQAGFGFEIQPYFDIAELDLERGHKAGQRA